MLPQIPLLPNFAISTYFLIISVAVTVSVLWFIRRAEAQSMTRVMAIDIALVTLIGGFLGARLLHVVWEEPDYYRQYPLAVTHVWNGGFVFLGGVLGAFVSCAVFCRVKREPFWFWADMATLPIGLAYALGRVACFANGCCYGKTSGVPWAVTLHSAPRHPTQLYASLWELVWLGLFLVLQRRFKTSGLLFNTWLVAHAFGRIVMENFRADPRGHLVADMSLGTVMSLGLMAFGVFNIVASRLQS